jgi:protein-disulfide isomerase
MGQSSSKREQIRKRNIQRKRKKWLTFAVITISIGLFISLIIFIPRIIAGGSSIKNNLGFELGDPNAPIIVEIFSSYSCSHCKTFAEGDEKSFIKDYVDTGKVFYRYINLPTSDSMSIAAAEASYCAADQNRFFEYKELLYKNAAIPDGFNIENLISYSNDIGLDSEQFLSCLESDKYADAYLDDRTYASSTGIKYTPSFLINGQIVTASELVATVEAILNH